MGLEMKYFVLKPEGDTVHAEASREAMRTYAEVLRHYKTEEGMARALDMWAFDCGSGVRNAKLWLDLP